MKTGGEIEPDTAHERVWEPYACQIKVSVYAEKCADVYVRGHEAGERFRERWCRARSNAPR